MYKALIAVLAVNLALLLLNFTSGRPQEPAETTWANGEVERWMIRPDERRNEQIHWVRGYREGLALASRHHRLLLLLGTHGDVCSGRI